MPSGPARLHQEGEEAGGLGRLEEPGGICLNVLQKGESPVKKS